MSCDSLMPSWRNAFPNSIDQITFDQNPTSVQDSIWQNQFCVVAAWHRLFEVSLDKAGVGQFLSDIRIIDRRSD